MALIRALPGHGPRAVFIDKDGTLVRDRPYNADPGRIELSLGAGPALAKLQAAGYALVVVSNQPGIALGHFSEDDMSSTWCQIARLLRPFGVTLDGVYYCPHHPAGTDARYACTCRCRKPQPGLLLTAAAEHGYDLSRSWMIGDILDDVEAGRRAGCRTVLLDVGNETEWRSGPWRRPDHLAANLEQAAQRILLAGPVKPRSPSPDPAAPRHQGGSPWENRNR